MFRGLKVVFGDAACGRANLLEFVRDAFAWIPSPQRSLE
jgi:hypothetical protein